MSYSTYSTESYDEWQAMVRCDGLPRSLKVRRRFGDQHTNGTSFPMESFQIVEGDNVKCVFILPTGPHRQAAKQTAMRTLPKFLGCTEIADEGGGDAADAIFGVIIE